MTEFEKSKTAADEKVVKMAVKEKEEKLKRTAKGVEADIKREKCSAESEARPAPSIKCPVSKPQSVWIESPSRHRTFCLLPISVCQSQLSVYQSLFTNLCLIPDHSWRRHLWRGKRS